MYQVGDSVSYGTTGVCRITACENKRLGDEVRQCYILKPIYDHSLTITVPTGNEFLMNKMHPVMSKDEAYALVREMPDEEGAYETDPDLRRQYYQETLKHGDRHELVRMIKSIYLYKQRRLSEGKRLSSFDENAMREAENVLYTELALALGIRLNEVPGYLQAHCAPQPEGQAGAQ